MSQPIPPVTNEQITGEFVANLIGTDAQMILEIGAHHGGHTAAFLKFFPRAQIHAFEPDPRAVKVLKSNVNDPRLRIHEIAIGAQNGKAEFHISSGLPPDATAQVEAIYPQGWDQSGSLRAPKTHKQKWPWCKFKKTITVAVRSLDHWAQRCEIGEIDFIWADMQGAEGDMIAGGQATLDRTRYLYTEYSNEEIYEGEPTLETLLAMLPKFSVVKRYPSDVLLKNMAFVTRVDDKR